MSARRFSPLKRIDPENSGKIFQRNFEKTLDKLNRRML